MRTIQRLVTLSLLVLTIWFLFLRSPKPPVPLPARESTDALPVEAINKLLRRKITKSRPVIFTIADKISLQNIFNIREKLEYWGRTRNFVVLCLDVECMEMDSDGIKRIDVGMVRGGRDTILILFLHHIVNNLGHSFLHLDSDICLTGTHDPFSRMNKLTDDNWDLQVIEQSNQLDPGFIFGAPTPSTITYLSKALQLLKSSTIPKNAIKATPILRDALRGLPIRFRFLDNDLFKSWSDHQAWEIENFATEPQIDQLIQHTIATHFTCIDKSLRPYFGKLYGGWSDYNGYYTNLRGKYLTITGISGSKEQLRDYIAMAVQLAIDSGRILILPYTVENIQKRWRYVKQYDGTQKKELEFHTVETFPFYRVIDILSLEGLVDYVEASFPLNREKYTGRQIFISQVEVDEEMLGVDTSEDGRAWPRILKKLSGAQGLDVVSLDVGGLKGRKVELGGVMGIYIEKTRAALRVCGNIDEEETGCEKRCT